eukprot:4029820-Amphidinium_carterae.1
MVDAADGSGRWPSWHSAMRSITELGALSASKKEGVPTAIATLTPEQLFGPTAQLKLLKHMGQRLRVWSSDIGMHSEQWDMTGGQNPSDVKHTGCANMRVGVRMFAHKRRAPRKNP